MLLRPVMEVALDLAALGVARGHDARTRRAELRVRRLELGRQTTVLDGQQQRVTRCRDELWVGVQSRVVRDYGHGLAVPRDRSRRLAGLRRGRKRLAGRVEKAACLLETEPDLERRIIECMGQGCAQLSGARVLDQAGDDHFQRRRGEERAHNDRNQKTVWQYGVSDVDQPAPVRERARIHVHQPDEGCVEDHDRREGHQSRDVDRQEGLPPRPSRRRQPVNQEDEDCGKGRQQVVPHEVLAEKTVGERRPIRDHEAVRGTRRVAVGERNGAMDDR